MDSPTQTSRRECEFSKRWMVENPQLAVQRIVDFVDAASGEGWETWVDSAVGFITLIAEAIPHAHRVTR